MIEKLFVCAALISVAYSLDCSIVPNGLYLIACKTYSTCHNGVETTHECPFNKVFNKVTQKCDFQSNVPAPCGLVRDCSSVHDGSYSDKLLNCTSYYTCAHKVYYGHNYCSPGTVFENTLGTCVWPADAYVPCGTKV